MERNVISMTGTGLQTRIFSSLAKIFADEEPAGVQWNKGSMLLNEVYSFQVAYSWKGDWNGGWKKYVRVRIDSELAPWITIRKVGLVPSEMPCYPEHDENVLRTSPGLYPDALFPLDDEDIKLLPEQWRTLWITVDPQGNVKPGSYTINIIFTEPGGAELGNAVFSLDLLEASLPEQKLIFTQWFHTDCLATWYGVEAFSDKHWLRIEQYIDNAVKHGINMILTPLFTPPLDTQVGGERPTVQLVDVYKDGDTFSFGFDKLKRWVGLCLKKGVRYFEFSPFFTQWGAKHAPKIMAWENGELKRIFGWETDAGGEQYRAFLYRFIPCLVEFLKENNIDKRSYFHISDEPKMEDFEYYRKASEIIRELLDEYPIIDALSDYIFYKTGLVKNPIPASNHIQEFLDNQVPNLWTYYCCSQYKQVSNRFFNMPSARNRVIGLQLYKFNIKGFLHWGYNFWYSQYSRYPIDPFRVTDAGLAFPSGDAFSVYPGENGPIDSLRYEVFYEALQDMRALELLEQYIGKEAVVAMLEEGLERPITFFEYPKDAEWLLAKREQINRKIAEAVRGKK